LKSREVGSRGIPWAGILGFSLPGFLGFWDSVYRDSGILGFETWDFWDLGIWDFGGHFIVFFEMGILGFETWDFWDLGIWFGGILGFWDLVRWDLGIEFAGIWGLSLLGFGG
jgi:hypothetical protein